MDVQVEEAGRRRVRGPSPGKTAQTRKLIVAAALDTFVDQGFHPTRMIDVAERAGVAKGTLYLYFADKEALFEGVLGDVVADLVSNMGESAPGPDESVRAFLARVVLPVLRTMESSRRAHFIRLVVTEGARFPALANSYRRIFLDPVSELIRKLARRALASGELTSDALLRFPLLLVAPGLLANVWNGHFGRDQPLDGGAMFEAYLDLVFGPGKT